MKRLISQLKAYIKVGCGEGGGRGDRDGEHM